MNDEELVSTNASQETLPPYDPPAAQTAEGGSETDACAQESLDESNEGGAPEQADPPTDPSEDPALPDDPVSDPDSLFPEDPDPLEAQSLEQLRDELKHLRDELHAREDFYARVGRDYEEFRTLYPDVSIAELPDSVWSDVKCGIPIAAAYALAEQRQRRLAEQAEAINRANAERSSGALASTEPEFFTPSEVRAMSRSEVRHNYQKIIRSMQKWN